MKRMLLLALVISASICAFDPPARAASDDQGLEQAIDYLVEFVRTSEVVFIRNDKEHNPEEAASHMLKKYKYAKRKVKTPEDFIKYCATKSTMSGKPYRVRLRDGKTITSEEWLLAALEAYRSGGAGAGPGGDIQYEVKEFREQYGTCPEPQEDCASVIARYPDFAANGADSALDLIASEINKRLLEPVYEDTEPGTFAELASTFIETYKNTQADFPDYRLGWTLEREASVEYAGRGLICIAFAEFIFTGGAHPNSSKEFANYRLSDGSMIALADLLVEGYGEELTRVAEAEFRAARELEDDESLEEAGFWFEDGEFTLNQNFAVTGKGLMFYFDYYEVAPYAMGPTEIIIPYDEIASLIGDDGLLHGVIK